MKYRPYEIYWYDSQDKRVGDRCQAGSPAVKEMSCPLMVGSLTKGKFGVYTCKAINRNHQCKKKIFEIKLTGKQIKTTTYNQTGGGGGGVFACPAFDL